MKTNIELTKTDDNIVVVIALNGGDHKTFLDLVISREGETRGTLIKKLRALIKDIMIDAT